MRIQNLTKTIDGKVILENITLELQLNQIIGLIGRNGVGKTTFFRTVVGHYHVDKGNIQIENKDFLHFPQEKEKLFYIDEQYFFFGKLTLKQIGAIYANNYGNFDCENFSLLLEKFSLKNQLKYQAMSKGMQGLFKMILAISTNAPYLFLDEPFDGLDVVVKKEVIRLLIQHLSENEKCVVISSHNLNELEKVIDRAVILKEKHIVQDVHLEQIRESSKKIQLVFKEKELPQKIAEQATSILTQGRVHTVIFENWSMELEQEIMHYQPIVLDELPLTLEDFFESKVVDLQAKQFAYS